MTDIADKKWHEKLTRHEKPVSHIAWRDIEQHAPESERNRLDDWMCGQTMLMRDDGDTGIYTWDFDRWLRLRQRVAPTDTSMKPVQNHGEM